MRTFYRKRSWIAPLAAIALILVLLLPSAISNATADEIPHENYDLVGSNLDVVISLLNSSIGFSEYALMAMYNESMEDVEQNLSIVRGILTPAEQLLGEIKNIATSYENLSKLLPPFANLSSQEDSFASMETLLIEARDELITASMIENLTGPDMIKALGNVRSVNSLLLKMNETIDEMLVSAHGIIALAVDSRKPFAQNQLVPLIEKLRDLLYTIKLQVQRIVSGTDETGGLIGPGDSVIKWGNTRPFLLLWLDRQSYFLGEEIRGGGYLFYNGTFAENHDVQILLDGSNLTGARTGYSGIYSFAYLIPLNSSWLGHHVVESIAYTPNGTLHSDAVPITISLIPTAVSLDTNAVELSLREQLLASVFVAEQIHGLPVIGAPCHFALDEINYSFQTDQSGAFHRAWSASELGYGQHSIQALYEGELPYAPSESRVVIFNVTIPTDVTLNLFSKRFYTGYQIVGNGTLIVNGTEPGQGLEVTLSVDGREVANVTTDSHGEFAFSIPTSNVTVGGHTLRAAFLHHTSIWRYSQDEQGFSVFGLKRASYPFWPSIPGWGGLAPPQSFTYLFVGDNAYFTWLLIIILLAITIRILQMNKRRADLAKQVKRETIVPLTEAPAPDLAVASADDIASMFSAENLMPSSPNERVIWYYHSMLDFLTRKRRISLPASMTHWEVASVLKMLGYPLAHVDRATTLFERALYSGTTLSSSDEVAMSSVMTNLLTTRKEGMQSAV